jgi:SET domain
MRSQQRPSPPVAASHEDSFLAWLQKRGFAPSCVTIGVSTDPQTTTGVRGVVSTADIPPNHTIFKIPSSCVLAAESSAFHPAIARAGLTGWNALVAALTYESGRAESPWRPYLDILPQTLDTPLFWSPEELALLDGTRADVRANAAAVRRVYDRVMRPFYDAHIEDIPDPLARSFETYRRYGSIVMSYSFTLGKKGRRKRAGGGSGQDGSSSDDEDDDEGDDDDDDSNNSNDDDDVRTVMIPMADMLNATPTGTTAHLFQGRQLSLSSLPDLEMQTTKSVPLGAEVLNTYGERPDSELLVRYGYVSPAQAPPNPSNAAALSAADLFAATQPTGGLGSARARLRISRLRATGQLPRIGSGYDLPFSVRELVFVDGRMAREVFGGDAVREAVARRLAGLARGDAAEKRWRVAGESIGISKKRASMARLLRQREHKLLQRLLVWEDWEDSGSCDENKE